MRLVYGYCAGKFVIAVTDDDPVSPRILQRISISRADAQRVSKHIVFGRDGQDRAIEEHEQLLVDPCPPALPLREEIQQHHRDRLMFEYGTDDFGGKCAPGCPAFCFALCGCRTHGSGICQNPSAFARADNGDSDTIVPAPAAHKQSLALMDIIPAEA